MKVIAITGVSSGIGLETAKRLVSQGHIVYGLSRTKIEEKGITSLQVDVVDQTAVLNAFAQIYQKEGKLDCVINNAGMGISGSIEDSLSEDVEYLFKVNFLGVFHTAKAAIPYLRTTGGGKIINIGSVAAVLPIPFQAFYSSSKAAINAFSDALATEVAPFKIQISTVLPGDIKTGFTKSRRKNVHDNPVYKSRIEKSIAVMEKDEQNGMPAAYAAKVIAKLVNKKRIPLYKTIGFKYKVFVFLIRLLPNKLRNNIVGSIYGFKKEDKK